MQIMPRDNAIVRFTIGALAKGKFQNLIINSIFYNGLSDYLAIYCKTFWLGWYFAGLKSIATVYVLQVKIKFRLNFFNLDWF